MSGHVFIDLCLSTIFWLNFGTFPPVWYFFVFFILFTDISTPIDLSLHLFVFSCMVIICNINDMYIVYNSNDTQKSCYYFINIKTNV